MKRLFAVLLAMAMVLSLAACGSAPASDSTQASEVSDTSEATEAPAVSETSAPVEEPKHIDEEPEPEEDAIPGPEAAGFYRLIDLSEEGTSSEDLSQLEELGLYCLLVLQEDGTGELSLFGESESLTWDDTSITVDGDPAEYTYEDGTVVIADEDVTMTFQKISEETYQEILEKMSDLDSLFSESDGVNAVRPNLGGALNIPESASIDPVSGELDGVHVDILTAEAFTDGDGKDAVRFYYDFTNTSDGPASAMLKLDHFASQEGYELIETWALDDVPEYANDTLDVRPGITIRCIAEYNYKPDGGPIIFTLTDFWGDESLSMQFDPANLPGRPAEDWAITPIPEPDWLDDVDAEGDLERGHVKISEASGGEDYNGDPMCRIYFDFTNTSDDATSFLIASDIRVMQDGIELFSTFTMDEVPEEDNYATDIAPGESITVARSYALRTESPVTVELYDWLTGEILLGAVILIAD